MTRSKGLGRAALTGAVLLGFSLTSLPCPAGAQTRRALLIGINAYNRLGSDTALARIGRDHIPALDGAVNDVLAMRDLLTARFGFDATHITLLLDTAATGTAILAAIRRLVADAQPGDVVFFYYAGHGSQRYNSLATTPTKLDGTIVPADANAGAFDIRSTELAQLFDALLDKHVTLTLFFDSCHSGAITRGGIPVTYRERWASLDPRDAADSSRPTPPQDRGALEFLSAQDYETAGEMKDESGVAHGVFSSALVNVLGTVPPDEPASRVFQRVKAIMQSTGRAQEPVTKGSAERLDQPVFGGSSGPQVTTVAMLRAGAPGEVELQGGIALGLRENTELVRYGATAQPPGAVKLRITKVSGLSRSTASVINGEPDSLHPGDLFVVSQWAPPPAAGLRVWLPPAAPNLANLAALRAALDAQWVDDPTALPADSIPLAIVQWTGAQSGWVVETLGKPITRITGILAPAAVQNALKRHPKKTRVFLYLPPTREFLAHLDIGAGTPNDIVQIVPQRGDADYLLVGRFHDGRIEYAWMRPNASSEMALQSTLPSRGNWVSDSIAPAALVDQALRLATVRSWLELAGPPSDSRFPYRLEVRKAGTGELKNDGPLYDGEYYSLFLHADSAQIKPSTLEPRRVYVIGIATDGSGVLLFPKSNVLNRVPYAPTASGSWPTEIRLGPDSLFPIGEPFGMDTYVLLTSDEVVPTDPLQWTGVRTRTARGGSALAKLLYSATSTTRAPLDIVPVNWSIQRLSILSAAKP